MKTKVELLTDNHDAGIARVFYVEKILCLGERKIEWGVYAENFDGDYSALVAIVSGPRAKQEAEKIATALESVLQEQKRGSHAKAIPTKNNRP